MKTLLSLAAIAAAALVATPAAAEAPARTLVVHYADLDLTKQSGVSTLDRRIRAAVTDACGTASDADLHGKNLVRQCRADTLESVAAQRDQAIALAQRASPVQLASQ